MSVFFRSKYGKVQLYSLTTGNIQPLLSLTNLKQVDIPILSKDVIDKITNNEKEANKLLIKSIKKIEEARSIFYDSLGFDIKNIKSDFSFNIKYNDLKEKDIWIPKHYSLLYENINKKLKESLKIEKLGSIVGESFHGIEVVSSNYNIYLDKEKNDKPFIRTSDIVNNSVDLYPDFYVSEDIYNSINQQLHPKDIIFTKDGKIGAVGMIMENDNCILSSGIQILRINDYARSLNITQEYLYLVLSIKEIGYYEAIRRAVVASTIPHLRLERMNDMSIPILSKDKIYLITKCVEEAFEYRNERIPLLFENDKIFERAFE